MDFSSAFYRHCSSRCGACTKQLLSNRQVRFTTTRKSPRIVGLQEGVGVGDALTVGAGEGIGEGEAEGAAEGLVAGDGAGWGIAAGGFKSQTESKRILGLSGSSHPSSPLKVSKPSTRQSPMPEPSSAKIKWGLFSIGMENRPSGSTCQVTSKSSSRIRMVKSLFLQSACMRTAGAGILSRRESSPDAPQSQRPPATDSGSDKFPSGQMLPKRNSPETGTCPGSSVSGESSSKVSELSGEGLGSACDIPCSLRGSCTLAQALAAATSKRTPITLSAT